MNIKGRENDKKGFRFDIIIIALLLVLSLVALGFIFITRESGTRVEVEIGGEVILSLGLWQNGEYEIGDGSNILVIENGEAYLSYADCPDHTCVKTGRIKYVGQTIVCLPNKVTVTVRGASGGVDLVS